MALTLHGVFEFLGLSAGQEAVYIGLLEQPGEGPRELTRATGMRRREVEEALVSLQGRGFVSPAADEPLRYFPIPPDEAILPLVAQTMEEMERARRGALELAQRYRDALRTGRPGDLVEIITDRDAVGHRFLQMERAATSEIVLLDRPPYAAAPNKNEPQVEALGRGVAFRTIYAREALEVPGQIDRIRELAEAGEQARVLPDLPAKLAIIDRRVGVIPLDIRGGGITGGVVIHASSMLDMLILFFEVLWERARPIGPSSQTSAAEAASTGEQNEVLKLLAAGLQDASIARALGISRTTVQRRVRDLMDDLGAKTRFQAGALAVEQNLLGHDV